jgi:hypothetical protein
LNKVFLTGRLKAKPDVLSTPKGERILKFPLWVEDDTFSIEVVYLDRQGIKDPAGLMGNTIMVSGTLTKSAGRNDAFKLKAYKISWMEE